MNLEVENIIFSEDVSNAFKRLPELHACSCGFAADYFIKMPLAGPEKELCVQCLGCGKGVFESVSHNEEVEISKAKLINLGTQWNESLWRG